MSCVMSLVIIVGHRFGKKTLYGFTNKGNELRYLYG